MLPIVDKERFTNINNTNRFTNITRSTDLHTSTGCTGLLEFTGHTDLPGLFPGKLAATIFNNKIELFEKVEGLFRC